MSGRCLGGCPDVAAALGLPFTCCASCHNEDDEFDNLDEQRESIADPDSDYVYACCASKEAIRKHPEPWQALRAHASILRRIAGDDEATP